MNSFSRSVSEDEDFYTLLGCDETSTVEQIFAEYKILVKKYHPDKVSDPEKRTSAEEHFKLLQRAKEVLLDESTRPKYDQWRTDFSMWISFDDWMKMQPRMSTSFHWAAKTQEPLSLQQSEKISPKISREAVVQTRSGMMDSDSKKNERESTSSAELQKFRRESQEQSELNKFRNYKL